jgi:hypothetical protein
LRSSSFRSKIKIKYHLKNPLCSPIAISPKRKPSKPKISEKYSTAPAPIKNSSPPK